MRRLTAIELREIACACRAAAYKAEQDAERNKASSAEDSFRESQKRHEAYAEMLEELAKRRG